MKKIKYIIAISALTAPSVLADYEHMEGYGMMNGMGLYGILWFILAAFVFAFIFWATYKLVIKDKTKKRKKVK